MMRLFVAVPLPAEVRVALAGLRSGIPGARWVDADNLHLTLRFIGEVNGDQAEDIDAVLSTVRVPAFDLAFSGIGCFETGRRVHTIWAGLKKCESLEHLADKVESAVVRAGSAPERRKFAAHVTIARLKNTPVRHVGSYLEAHNGFSTPPFPVSRFTLFRSFPNRQGPHYEAIADYPLDEVGQPSKSGNSAMSANTASAPASRNPSS